MYINDTLSYHSKESQCNW